MSTFCSASEYLHSSTKPRPAFQTDLLRGPGSSVNGCFGIIRSVTLQSLWSFSSLSSPVTGGPALETSEHLRQRYVYASLLCRAGVQISGTLLDDGFFCFFYLVLKETKALTLLAFVWVNLSAKPTFNKGKTDLKDVKIWTVCEPPGVDSCFCIVPRCIVISDCNQRYGSEPPVVSLWENAACARLVWLPSSNGQPILSNWCLTFLLYPKEDSPLSVTRVAVHWTDGILRSQTSLKSSESHQCCSRDVLFIFLIVFLASHAALSVLSCKLWDFSCSPWAFMTPARTVMMIDCQWLFRLAGVRCLAYLNGSTRF